MVRRGAGIGIIDDDFKVEVASPNMENQQFRQGATLKLVARCTPGQADPLEYTWTFLGTSSHEEEVDVSIPTDAPLGQTKIKIYVKNTITGKDATSERTIEIIKKEDVGDTPVDPTDSERELKVEIIKLFKEKEGPGSNILNSVRRYTGENKITFEAGTNLGVEQTFFHWKGKVEYRVTLARYIFDGKKWNQITPIVIERKSVEITKDSYQLSEKITLEKEGMLYRYIIEAWSTGYDKADSHLHSRDYIDLYTKQAKKEALPPNVWVDLDEDARKHRIPIENEKPRIKFGLNKNFEKGSKNYATVTNGDARIKQNFEINNRKPCGAAKYVIRFNAIEVSKELFVKPLLDLSDLKGEEINPPLNIVCKCEGFAKRIFESGSPIKIFKPFSIAPGKSQVASMRFNVPDNFCTDKERYIFFIAEVRDKQDDHIQHVIDFNYRRIIAHPSTTTKNYQEAIQKISAKLEEKNMFGAVFPGFIDPHEKDPREALAKILKNKKAKANLTSDKAFWVKDWGITKDELKKVGN